jgi:hypothetical protein
MVTSAAPDRISVGVVMSPAYVIGEPLRYSAAL